MLLLRGIAADTARAMAPKAPLADEPNPHDARSRDFRMDVSLLETRTLRPRGAQPFAEQKKWNARVTGRTRHRL
jgi:hypothetical protein